MAETITPEKQLQWLIEQANEFKAEQLHALRVTEQCSFTDYFLFMSASSKVHVQSIAEHLLKAMKHHGVMPMSVEGQLQGEWCLLDFGDVIVHIFLPQSREFYGLEELWKDAETVYPPG